MDLNFSLISQGKKAWAVPAPDPLDHHFDCRTSAGAERINDFLGPLVHIVSAWTAFLILGSLRRGISEEALRRRAVIVPMREEPE
jgi:hypothetical protein